MATLGSPKPDIQYCEIPFVEQVPDPFREPLVLGPEFRVWGWRVDGSWEIKEDVQSG